MPDIIYHGKSQDIFFKGKLYNRKEKIEGNYNKIECTKEEYESLTFYDNSTIYVVTYPDESMHFYLGSEEIAGNPTLINKTITVNGTYSAEDDNADGYSVVTANINSIDISPDLMGYIAGDTDLGNGFVLYDTDTSGAIVESGTYTINNHDYSGLRLKGRPYLRTPAIPFALTGSYAECKFVIKEKSSEDVSRIISPRYEESGDNLNLYLFTEKNRAYIEYRFDNCTILDPQLSHSYYNYVDPSLIVNNIIDTEMTVKWISDGTYITMLVNDVPKAKIECDHVYARFNTWMCIGGCSYTGHDIIITKAKVHIEKEA